MKITIEFDDADEDYSRSQMLRTVHADNAFMALWDLDQFMRSQAKYENNEEAARLRTELHEILGLHGIDLDTMIE